MVQKVLVFLYPGCAEFEITVACWQIAESSKYEIVTIAYDHVPISTNSGFSMVPDELVSDIKSCCQTSLVALNWLSVTSSKKLVPVRW